MISQQEGKVDITTRGESWDPINRFNTATLLCFITSEDLYFERQMPWSPFFVLTELRWEVIVHFVDIGGIVDHHSCLNVFFL